MKIGDVWELQSYLFISIAYWEKKAISTHVGLREAILIYVGLGVVVPIHEGLEAES